MKKNEMIIRALVYTDRASECSMVERFDDEKIEEFFGRIIAVPMYALESGGCFHPGRYMIFWTDDRVDYEEGLAYPAGCDQHLEHIVPDCWVKWHSHDGERDHYQKVYFYRMED